MKKLSLLFFILMLGIGAFAQTTRYWSGKSTTTDNISDNTNWWDEVKPNSGDHLFFDHTDGRHEAYFNYGTGSWFGDIKIIEGAGSIKFLGDNTYANKFENNSENELFEIANGTIGNRLGKNLEINPVGTGGILVSGSYISLDGAKTLHFYGANTATINGEIKEVNGSSSVYVHESKVILKSASTYTGTTRIDNLGVLEVQKDISSSEIIVANGAKLIINGTDVDIQKLTINTGGTVEVLPGKSLTVNDVLTNNGILTLKSDANGTATIKTLGTVTNGGTTNYKVEQYLASQRNWYMSSPVSGTATVTGAGVDYYTHAEANGSTADGWSVALENLPTVASAEGFIVKPSAAGTITFTGTLNNADVTRALTRTAYTPKPGFNLVGNPFTAYLPWTSVWAVTSNQTALSEGTMWYRTVINNMYAFATVNAQGVAVTGADNNIPPMQAFWVRAAGAGNFTLNKSFAAHDASTNMLKAPAASSTSFPMLRMVVSNGTLSDEVIVYFSEKSSNDKDANDASKMFNGNSIPEIYTLLNGTAITINSMNSIPYNTEISLGFRTQNPGEFTLTASEFSNFAAGEKVILRDKVANKEIVLSDASYSFTAEAGVSDNRFAIVFPKSDVSTSTGSIAGEGVFAYARNQRIVVNADAATQGAMIYVFNSVGQRVASQAINGLVNEVSTSLPVGVYVVKVNNHSTKVVVK